MAPRKAAPKQKNSWKSKLRTSVVAVVLLSATSLSVLAVRRPVGHATQLVALGERRIRNTIQRRLGHSRRAPSIFRGQGRDEVG